MRLRTHLQFPLALILLSSAVRVEAVTHLTGSIQGAEFDAAGSPYIAEQDLVIPAGATVRIPAGCIVLFKPFTGLKVEGTLLAEGTAEKPVIFTSYNDDVYNSESENLPSAFDWNGIMIAREASGVSLKNFVLNYSVFGIKATSTDIVVDHGVFSQNGQYHFTVQGKIEPVEDKVPYYYNVKKPAETGTGSGTVVAQPSDPRHRKAVVKNVAATVSAVAALGLGAVAVVSGLDSGKKQDKADEYRTQFSGLPDDSLEAKRIANRNKNAQLDLAGQARTTAIITGISGGVFVPVAAILYAVKIKKPEAAKNLSAAFLGNGVLLTVRF